MIITYIRSSSFNTWKFCNHQYFLEYVLGIDTISGKKAEKGTIVHKTLEVLAHEKLARQNGKKRYTDDVIGTHRLGALKIPAIHDLSYNHYVNKSPHKWTPRDHKDCLDWTHKAVALHGGMFDPRKRNILYPEVHFDFEIEQEWAAYKYTTLNGVFEGRLSMKGTIDLVTKINKNTIEVVDWKTGMRKDWTTGEPKTYEYLCNDPQLRIYHYALAHEFPQWDNIIITIYFINDGGPFTVTFNKDDVAITEEMLRKRYETIKVNTMPYQRKGWWCSKFCHFGKNNFEGSNQTICEDVHKELVQIGMPKVVQNHTISMEPKPWDSYNAPG